ncbi:hypothetical protein MA16_Dca010632 [Dendrobium catenatum]|uniref:Uncharacterized protein n=1 Tax=Dendrobium catenatum TaxID=906689 RepID=A0A2I0VZQ9_9ASPA|nr:hypothetical protein MA16_Dca010632 [Dendrobium catenatum]
MQRCSSSMEENILHHDLSLLPSPSTSFSIEIEEKKKNTVFGGESEEGYHTPTSPRHLIRPANECPPAPKKIKMRKKRKIESRGRRIQCWVEDDEFNELLNRTKKKTKSR